MTAVDYAAMLRSTAASECQGLLLMTLMLGGTRGDELTLLDDAGIVRDSDKRRAPGLG